MMIIPLTLGQVTVVNDSVFRRFGHLEWCAHWNLCTQSYYAVRNVRVVSTGKQKMVYLHREITGAPDGMDVDHGNHDTLDNRNRNLNVCSHASNIQNRKGPSADSRSGILGASRVIGSSRWKSEISFGGKYKYLGSFSSKHKAGKAYATALKKFRGLEKSSLGGR